MYSNYCVTLPLFAYVEVLRYIILEMVFTVVEIISSK